MIKKDVSSALRDLSQEKSAFYWLFLDQDFLVRSFLSALKKKDFSVISSKQGSETPFFDLQQELQTLPLGAQSHLVVVREPEKIAHLESLLPFLTRFVSLSLHTVLVFISDPELISKKPLKSLMDLSTVITEPKITPVSAAAWIKKLSQSGKEKIPLSSEQKAYLMALDPWSLDRVYSEMQKMALSEDWQGVFSEKKTVSFFIDHFLSRNKKASLEHMALLFEDTGFFLHLGLLSWHLRQLIQFKTKAPLSDFVQKKIAPFAEYWSLSDLKKASHALLMIDFKAKQTHHFAVGLVQELISVFCLK